jgi:hypothetical protein
MQHDLLGMTSRIAVTHVQVQEAARIFHPTFFNLRHQLQEAFLAAELKIVQRV